MPRSDIINRLKKTIKKVCPNKEIDYDNISEESTLKEDLMLNSIDIIMIAIAIEMEFGIEFTNYNVNTFDKVKNVVDYIEEKSK